MTTPTAETPGQGWINRFLDVVVRWGNKLPHPFYLFLIIYALLLVISNVVAYTGLSVTDSSSGDEVTGRALISAEGLRFVVESFRANFQEFVVLGYLILTIIGVGVAERTGLITAIMNTALRRVSERWFVPTLAFLVVSMNFAGDAAIVVIPPLAAAIFAARGKSPLLGLILSYGMLTAGWSASFVISPSLDLVLLGLSEEAAKTIDPNIIVSPLSNYYFTFTSALILPVVGIIVTYKVVEPRIRNIPYTLPEGTGESTENQEEHPRQSLALKLALLTAAVFVLLIVLSVAPSGAPLRNPEDGSIVPDSPFFSGLAVLFMLLFLLPSIVYGRIVGTIQTGGDLVRYMTETIQSVAGYILLIIVIAQFVAAFDWSNLPVLISVGGADFLQAVGLNGVLLLVVVALAVPFLDVFVGSASSKWALLSVVLVPLFMQLGFHPAATTMAYRIGDSVANSVSPLFPYFPILLGYVKRYTGKEEIGTVLSLLLPYALSLMVVWVIMFVAWLLLGLPFGPGGSVHYP